MQMCDPRSLLRLARCTRQLYVDASNRIAWKVLSEGGRVHIQLNGRDDRSKWTHWMNSGRRFLRRCIDPSGDRAVRWNGTWLDESPLSPTVVRVNKSLLRFCDMVSRRSAGNDCIRAEKLSSLVNLRGIADRMDVVTQLLAPSSLSQASINSDTWPSELQRLAYTQPLLRKLAFCRIYVQPLFVEMHDPDETRFPHLHSITIHDMRMDWPSHNQSWHFWTNLFVRADTSFPHLTTLNISNDFLQQLATAVAPIASSSSSSSSSVSHGIGTCDAYAALNASLRTLTIGFVLHPAQIFAFVQKHLPSLTALTLKWHISDAWDKTKRDLLHASFEAALAELLDTHAALQTITLSVPPYYVDTDEFLQDPQLILNRASDDETAWMNETLVVLRATCNGSARMHTPRVAMITQDPRPSEPYCIKE